MTLVDQGYSSNSGPIEDKGKEGPPSRNGQGPDRLAKLVKERWDKGSEELAINRRNFWQNLSFYMGEQWVYWEKRRNIMQAMAHTWSPLGAGKARVTVNRIRLNMHSLLARVLRNEIEFDVPPTSSADDVTAAAYLAEDIIAGTYHDRQWSAARQDTVFAAFMGGTSAVALDWDPSQGVALDRNPATGAIVGTGDVQLQVLNVTEFVLEPGCRTQEDARWWVQGVIMHPNVAKAKFNLSWKPKADASALVSPLQSALLEKMGRPSGGDMVLVLCLYERPNKDVPQGRYVCVINEQVVMQSAWPFKTRDALNLFLFRQDQLQGTWQGSTILNDAVPVQMNYNYARSNITEHMKEAGNVRLMGPAGSVQEEDLTDSPSNYFEYQSDIGGGKPEYLTPPQLPRWMLQEEQDLKAELDDIMHVHETSRGMTSVDRASGQALALLAEKDDSPLGLIATDQKRGWSAIATWVLTEYESRVKETRTVHVPPKIGVENQESMRITQWTGSKLKGQTRVYVPLDSVMPYSQAAMQSFANDLWDRKIVTDPMMFARIVRLPARQLTSIVDADVARAQRENARLMQGEVEMPQEFDVHSTHIAEHNRMRKSDSYQYAPQQIKQLLDDHIAMHENMAHEELAQQMLRAQENPALAAAPQAGEPAGSQVPPDYAEQRAGAGGDNPGEMAAMAALASGGGGTPAGAGAVPQQGGQGPPQLPGGGDVGSVGMAGT